MRVYSALEVAQLEWFTTAGRPAASAYPYRIIWNTTDSVVQVSDGSSWLTGGVADNSVTNAKLADMAQALIKGRAASAGTGDPTDLTAQQVRDIIYGQTIITEYNSGSGTHTYNAATKRVEVIMVAGGGGGGGAGTASAGTGGTGGNTTFGTLTANGGTGGAPAALGGAGGAGTIGAGFTGFVVHGNGGAGGQFQNINSISMGGGQGGGSMLGGGARGQIGPAAGADASGPNTGGGGGVGMGSATIGMSHGSGGGGGGGIRAFSTGAVSGTASYSVGSAGTAGTAGTSGQAAGNGASGKIIVIEYLI